MPSYDLCIVIPTLNERENIALLLEKLRFTLHDIRYEVIVVDDDSPDGTAAAVKTLSRTQSDLHVIHRIGRRGLASACIEGMLATSATYIAVMDADLQHDETVLPEMVRRMRLRKPRSRRRLAQHPAAAAWEISPPGACVSAALAAVSAA